MQGSSDVQRRTSLRTLAERGLSPLGLAALRVLLGLVLCAAMARFVLKGWVHDLIAAPGYHFHYWGFAWVPALPEPGLLAVYGLAFACALGMVLGWRTRVCSAVFCLLFTYCELIDVSLYLNHYYLVSLLTGILALLPSGVTGSTWAVLGGKAELQPVVAYSYWILRLQMALVYFYAGVAKLEGDWLFRAEPLTTWLATFADFPVIGGVLAQRETAYVMSWAGAVFDLAVALLLGWRRTRPYAYCVLLGFHALIWLLFPVGIFSWVMVVAATIFFDPTWPARLPGLGKRLATLSFSTRSQTPQTRPGLFWLLVAHGVLQVLVPLRFCLYPGSVNWTNEGFRFAWRVMLVEKTGQVEFRVQTEQSRADDLDQRVYPQRELSRLQYAQMSIQPDLILEYAKSIKRRYESQGQKGVRVYADAWASLNGRPAARLIDPTIDLAAQPMTLLPKPWIIPFPTASL
jgi:hypothetical protein